MKYKEGKHIKEENHRQGRVGKENKRGVIVTARSE